MAKKKITKHFFTRMQLEDVLDSVRGKTLGEVDSAHVFDKTKEHPKVTGIAGDVIEQSVLGYPADVKQEPDLIVDGEEVELKTTGLRPSKKDEGLEAKEPMTITAVSLENIADETFYDSSFWHKIRKILVVYYLYDSERTVTAAEYARFTIKGHQLHVFSKEEEETLKNDWQLVHDFVRRVQETSRTKDELREGYARLSSALRGDLMMIDTAPKYPNPPRFRLKRSVVTYMARKIFKDRIEMLPVSVSSFGELEKALRPAMDRYSGRRLDEVFQSLHISEGVTSKNAAERMIVAMLGGTGKINNVDLFVKTGIKVKSITLSKDGKRTEDMKLCPISFDELSTCSEYEASLLHDYLASPFVMAVFQEPSARSPLGENVFLGFKRFAFADGLVEGDARWVWEECRALVNERRLKETPVCHRGTNEPILNKAGTIRTQLNFPKAKEHVLFVRGSGSDSTKKPECVNGICMYRQQFWVQGKYMVEKLQEVDWI